MEKFLARLLVVALFAAVLIVVPYSADPGAAQAVDSPVLVNVAPDGIASGSSQLETASTGLKDRSTTETTQDHTMTAWMKFFVGFLTTRPLRT